MDKMQLGKHGENIACKYLKKHGFEIIQRNFKIMGGEIDIICKKENEFRVVEVKTRQNEDWQEIEDAITEQKIKFLINAFEVWIGRKNLDEPFWQIDFIGIIVGPDGNPVKLVHLEDI